VGFKLLFKQVYRLKDPNHSYVLPVVPADRVVAADVGDSSSLCPPTMLTGDSGTTYMLVYFAIAMNE
jgi:hypothetical protein